MCPWLFDLSMEIRVNITVKFKTKYLEKFFQRAPLPSNRSPWH